MSSDYALNVVACKLSDLVGSPPESILGVAVFDQLASLYPGWRCWVYSEWEFQTFAASAEQEASPDTFALVPQREVVGVGRVDFAIFVPHISRQKPLVVVEVDGHDYHERTSGQASSDNRRDRALQRLGISVFRFTATDVLRNSAHAAREIAGFVHDKLHENAARATELAELEAAAWDDGYQYGFLLS